LAKKKVAALRLMKKEKVRAKKMEQFILKHKNQKILLDAAIKI
jgi:hypothetical protein